MLFTRIICVMKYFSSTVNFCVVGLTAHLLTACLHCYCEKNIYIEDKKYLRYLKEKKYLRYLELDFISYVV